MNNEHTSMIPFLAKVSYGAVSIGLMATYGWPLIVLLAPSYFVAKAAINSPAMRDWAMRVVTTDKLPKLLPAPKNGTPYTPLQAPIQSQTKTLDPYAHLGFWDRVTKPYDNSTYINTRGAIEVSKNGKMKQNAEDRQYGYLNYAIKRLPTYFHYTDLPNTIPSKLSVPIGKDAQSGEVIWGDFDADSDRARILHAMIAGQTGSGKDALLRLWFTTLTLNNTPEEIQFVILDGKIDWLSDALAASVYMAIPPAGGIQIVKRDGKRVDLSHERMTESMDWVFDEIDRRSDLLRKAGAVNLNAYNKIAVKRGDKPLPMIFLIASDVGRAFDGTLGMLVNNLIMKGRAYGIRMIISMQDPVGEDTGWRAQIGLVMSGYQQNPDHDRFIMGIYKDRALVRPSQLPNPEEDDIAKGLFVVRQGSKQYLVRTPHLPEEDWFAYIESNRFFKKWYTKEEQQNYLNDLLSEGSGQTRRFTPIPPRVINPKDILTHEQIEKVARLARMGLTKTEIMERMGFTNNEVWAAKKTAVEQVIIAARGHIKR